MPSPGTTVNNHYLSEGAVLRIPYYVVHGDTVVLGEDAHLFRPERWLDAEPSTIKRMDQIFLALRLTFHQYRYAFSDT